MTTLVSYIKTLFLFIIAGIFLTSCTTLKIVDYDIDSQKIIAQEQNTATIILISDLHSCNYGQKQCELLQAVKTENPDLIIFAGDIIDENTKDFPLSNAYTILKECAKLCPCFYSTGNHEYYNTISVEKLKQTISSCGIVVLDGIKKDIRIRTISLQICGIDDICEDEKIVKNQLARCNKYLNKSYSILISHRPFMIDAYLNTTFDLILCGHEHGGQWAIPGIINGVYSHEEGLLPQHSGGLYYYKNGRKYVCKSRNNQLFITPIEQDSNDSIMIVSRGLARETTTVPRIGNSPELCVIHLY